LPFSKKIFTLKKTVRSMVGAKPKTHVEVSLGNYVEISFVPSEWIFLWIDFIVNNEEKNG